VAVAVLEGVSGVLRRPRVQPVDEPGSGQHDHGRDDEVERGREVRDGRERAGAEPLECTGTESERVKR
jgi:hypothetical protein